MALNFGPVPVYGSWGNIWRRLRITKDKVSKGNELALAEAVPQLWNPLLIGKGQLLGDVMLARTQVRDPLPHLSVFISLSSAHCSFISSSPYFQTSFRLSSVPPPGLALCDPVGCSKPGLPVHHQPPESTPTLIHWVSDAIQPTHPLSSPSPALTPSQNRGLFIWVSSSHQVAKVLELQLQHQSFQWTLRTDLR